MLVKTKREGDILVASVSGQLDSNTCGEFGECIEEDMNDEVKYVIFDFNEIDYIASAGLRILLKMYKTMKERGGEAVVSQIPKFVQQIFEIAGFDSVLKYFDGLEEAKEYIVSLKE